MNRSALKSLLGLSVLGAMMSASTRGSNDGSFGHGIPDEKPKIIPQGCKEYSFYGHTVVAISEKSARKKCKRLFDKQNSKS